MAGRKINGTGWRRSIDRYRYWLMAIATALLFLLSPMPQAQSAYPPFMDPHVNDYGQILTTEDAAALRSKLAAFQEQTGIQTVVLTVNSIHDYGTEDSTLEAFATNLFNIWGIGDGTRNDGILLLVAPGDRQVRIELGSGYGQQHDRIAQSIIDESLLPHFREGEFSDGTVAGAEAIVQRLAGGTGAIAWNWANLPTWVPIGAGSGGFALVTGLWMYLQYWWRTRPRPCPRCKTQMIRLDERQDDAYLDPGQQREEALKSVDYDVWQCPSCGYHTEIAHENWMTRYKRCPHCGHKTVSTHTRILRHATESHEGEKEITESCQHCFYRNTYHRSIPKVQSDHGGGGSSSGGGASGSWGGGGSSSGGGASGNW